MRYKKRVTKMYDESSFVTNDEIAKLAKQTKSKPKEYDVETKEQLRQNYLPVWKELAKKYYSPEMLKKLIYSIEGKLLPTSAESVSDLSSKLELVFGVLELAHMGNPHDAQQLYLSSSPSALERSMKYSNYVKSSYYAKEMLDVLGSDVRQVCFEDSRQYFPIIKQMKADAEQLKKAGTVEMKEKQEKLAQRKK